MSRNCHVENCERPYFGLGYCSAHYRRFVAYGDPLKGQRAERGSLLKWLRDHADYQIDECLSWPFGRKGEYGCVTFRATRMKASRAMCFLAHGEPPDGKPEAAHICGNAICVNPRHVRWASPMENTADKWRHGTMLLGEKVNGSKLSETNVRKIRSMYPGLTIQKIADEFGVSFGGIQSVISGRTWRYVK